MKDFEMRPAADLGLTLRERLQSPRRERGLMHSIGHWLWALAMRGYFQVWHGLRVEGRENLPKEPPFILIANHISHLDALVLAAPLPLRIRDRVFPLAAGDVFFESTVLAAFATGFLNAIPLWRRRSIPRTLQELRRRLVEEPCAYILFPEGGRSRDGKGMRFKPGVGMLVAQTQVPIVPCYLRGCLEAFPPGARFPRPRRIDLRIGQPLCFPDVPNERDGWDDVVRQVEARVRELGASRPDNL